MVVLKCDGKIYHDSHEEFFRNPFGAVKCEENIVLRLQVSNQEIIKNVSVIITEKNISKSIDMFLEFYESDKKIYRCIVTSSEPMLIFYYFQIEFESKTLYYGNNDERLGGVGEVYLNSPIPFQITVYKRDLKTPYWFKNSIIYQIFVDRFYNGNENGVVLNPKENSFIYGSWYDKPMYIKKCDGSSEIERWDFYGGNLKGIIKKLDYLKKLGISVIYLNPIFESRSNHKYDTSNYKIIDPMFGDDEVFQELVNKAKKQEISIILDGVFSHTGADSIYFNKYNNYNEVGAYQSKESAYYSWYTFNKYPDKYECWWNVDDLPNVNEMNESYLNYIIKDRDSVINHWLEKGVKGFRLDVADELPDEFICTLKNACRAKDNQSVLIGEVWEDASNKISYGKQREYFLGCELDSVTNYPLREILFSFISNKINAELVHKKLLSLYENYPCESFYSLVNLLGSHDVERIWTMMTNYAKDIDQATYENTLKLLKLVTLIQFTMPGVPLIYYGDEAGIEGLKDPHNRAAYPWGEENIELTNWYKTIINIRNENPVLRTGFWTSLYYGEDVYGFIRYIKNSKDVFEAQNKNAFALVLINKNASKESEVNLVIGTEFEKYTLVNPLEENDAIELNSKTNIKIQPLGFKIYLTNFSDF